VSRPDLRLDFVGRSAVEFACHRWHYSKSVPASKMVAVGACESERYVGCVTFSRGASSEIGSPFGLEQDEVCELTRVALGPHVARTSRIVAIAMRLLRRQSPGLRLIVSYADPEQRGPSGDPHLGVLYQALSFQFIGCTNRESLIRLNGRLFHPRTVTSRYATRAIDWLRQHVAEDAAHVRTAPKFRYAMALDPAMRAQLAPRVQPYPKNASKVLVSGTPDSRRGSPSLGGAQRRGPCDGSCSLSPVPEARHV
jgi:hypothetical protein